MFAKVIVDIGAAALDRIFDYAIPDSIGTLMPGARVMVPFGPKMVEGFVVGLSDESGVPLSRMKSVLRLLDAEPPLLPALLDLAFWVRDTYHCLLVDALRLMLPAQMRGGRVKEKVVPWIQLEDAPAGLDKETAFKRSPALLRALTVLEEAGGFLQLSRLRAISPLSRVQLAKLVDDGWVSVHQAAVMRQPYGSLGEGEVQIPDVTADQAKTIHQVCHAMDCSTGSFLLRGVTGSGKTEVYIRCAQHALAQGKGVLILVPEIALTPQMVSRFLGRFGKITAVLHSRLSVGERFDEWQRIRRGEAKVVIGARSAVFAPMLHLGLVVIDEEHESSYRSDHTPRYDAVEVAHRRCLTEGAVFLAGSATPSVNRYFAAAGGEFTLLTMPKRIGDYPMPPVELVDMRQELLHGNRTIFSGRLVAALSHTLKAGEQAILFMNRRGYASFVSCRVCGHVMKCDDCDMSMTYHKEEEMLMCHYCGKELSVPHTCPSCGSRAIRQFGGGTEKVEEEVRRLFPDTKVLRMDADTTRKKEGHLTILEAFGRGDAQVLVGTQMVAKGLDFPHVTLVGVVAADMSLYTSDFRAGERTFDLVAQVAGRAGRSNQPGCVVVQTYSPEHSALVATSKHDYQAFYQDEIASRKLLQLPPYAAFYRLMLQNEDADAADADLIALDASLCSKVEELGIAAWILQKTAGKSPIGRIRGTARRQILIKTPKDAVSVETMLAQLVKQPLPKKSLLWLEIDPGSML